VLQVINQLGGFTYQPVCGSDELLHFFFHGCSPRRY
jgi:hypothetical protein